MNFMDFKKVLASILLLSFILPCPPTSFAEEITITAKVGMSDLWAETIANDSKVILNSKKAETGDTIELSFILGTVGGVNLKNEKIIMHIYNDEKLIDTKISLTDGKNRADFDIYIEDESVLRLEFWDYTHERDVKINHELIIDPKIINYRYVRENFAFKIVQNLFLTVVSSTIIKSAYR
jgi:hypothetical protein